MKRVLMGLTLLVLLTVLHSQMLPLQNFNTRDGLPQSQVMSIFQDSRGFVWFSTQGGVTRFDGVDFLTYSIANGLGENTSHDFMEDRGILYLVGLRTMSALEGDSLRTWDAKYFQEKFGEEIIQSEFYWTKEQKAIYLISRSRVFLFNALTGEFQPYYSLDHLGLEIDIYTRFSFIRDGVFTVSTKEGSYLIDPAGGREINLNNAFGFPAGQYIFVFLSDIEGREEDYFLEVYDIEKKTTLFTHYRFDEGILHERKFPHYVSLLIEEQEDYAFYYQKPDGVFWLYDPLGGIWTFNIDTDKWQKQSGRIAVDHAQSRLILELVNDSYLDCDILWLATPAGVVKYNLSTDKTEHYTTRDGLSSNLIESIMHDRENNFWFGTNGNGVDMMIPGMFRNVTRQSGLPHDGVTNVVEDDEGRFWFSTDSGIARFDRERNIRVFTTDDGLLSNDAWALGKDAQGRIWAGTIKGGIHRFDGQRFVSMLPSDAKRDEGYITEIFLDNGDNLWIPRTAEMYLYTPEGLKIVPFGEPVSIYQILETTDGAIWAAGDDMGLLRFDRQGKLVETFKDPDLFTANINGLAQMGEDDLWCSTYGEGIVVFNMKHKRFVKHITEPFGDAQIIKSMIKDEQGTLWVGTIGGIFHFEKDGFHRFTVEDGMIANATRNTGVYRDSEGKLWFTSSFGAMRLDPAAEVMDSIPPLVYIDEFLVNRQPQKLDIPGVRHFSYNQNNMTFQMIGLDYRNPHKIRYQYYLEGFEDNWSPWSEETLLRYTNLDAGDYQLLVRASDRYDNLSETVSLRFTIATPFWQTWWFVAIEVIAATGLIFLLVRWRLNALKRQNEELERIVSERTHELKEKNEQIMSSIRYAERIQQAILPWRERIAQSIRQFFIIYEPRDIIAGDFYWFSRHEKYLFIAVVDCTGHGVPGALLSMVGNLILKEIVDQNREIHPRKILQQMHQRVTRILKQERVNSNSREGMEISLCRIDLEKNRLLYAGAGRPLYLVRRNEESGIWEVQLIRGNRKGIGGQRRHLARSYADHEIRMHVDDMLYIMTDGFVDQMNEDGLKFGSRKLRDLLVQIAPLGMAEQKRMLEEAASGHRGDADPVDDVTLMGIRIDQLPYGDSERMPGERTSPDSGVTPVIGTRRSTITIGKNEKEINS